METIDTTSTETIPSYPKGGRYLSAAFADIREALNLTNLWSYLAYSDIKQRYRGSVIGPLWITLSMCIFIAALSVVYSKLFHQNLTQFIPFLTCGVIAWTFITAVIVESTEAFISAKDFILNKKFPYFLFIFKLVYRNILIMMHNLMVYVIVVLAFGIKHSMSTFYILPAFLLVLLSLTSISVVVAVLGTRYRDIPPIINSLVTVAFFVSPVTWPPSMLGKHSYVLLLNPFSYYLDLIRSPMLGQPPEMSSFVLCSIMTLLTCTISFFYFAYHRKNIAFWL